ncbi:class I SAM-dependent methyltransferase [Roseibium salinum]|uniref:Methyltransferase domain-containing protein n=1 Tax=Roseibium salinum TaxID=1604349 RepID=A0ABT3QVH5_9HYPH|nr:methyltransferase domain-containing protein [Roseibium sp. DSM 29163]MCX2720909.1 methyltransferase domain-containing protein [Roseibium sp. DSM 29163]MDN3722344.1 methyltransferase domain-containing protein [Roseibium salinum]
MSLALWNHPVTADRYRHFTGRHDRYRRAARALVEAAAIAPGHRVLDFAAGIGCTALASLEQLGQSDVVTAVEAAEAMRLAGAVRTRDLPVNWCPATPAGQHYDRVICGAAIWALGPVADVVADLAGHVAPGGALAVSLPAAYLGEPDVPGGGSDPWLGRLPEVLAGMKLGKAPIDPLPPLNDLALTQAFADSGFSVIRTTLRQRLSQTAYCDWMTLPPVNDTLLGQLPPEDRIAVVGRAASSLDTASWRWEAWALYTGVRQEVQPLRISTD